MVRTKQQRRRDRKRQDAAVPPVPAQVTVSSVTAGTNQVTVAFASPVQISPSFLPTTWLFGTGNRTITGIASSSPTAYVFDVSGSVAAAQAYAISGLDPAARTPTGGFVAAKSGNLA